MTTDQQLDLFGASETKPVIGNWEVEDGVAWCKNCIHFKGAGEWGACGVTRLGSDLDNLADASDRYAVRSVFRCKHHTFPSTVKSLCETVRGFLKQGLRISAIRWIRQWARDTGRQDTLETAKAMLADIERGAEWSRH